MRGAVTAAPPAADALHDEMLATAVEEGLLTAEEAEAFRRVHAVLDEDGPMPEAAMHAEGGPGPEAMRSMGRARAAAAVADGRLCREDADAFTRIHDLLVERGLMAP